MTTLRAILASALIAVTFAACDAPAPADRGGSGTVTPSGAAVDLSFACQPKDALCEGNAVRTCVFDPPSDSWLFGAPVACDYLCLAQTQAGRPAAACVDCQPGSSTCDQTDGIRYRCDASGHWQSAGSCGPRRCDCGGTYPSCKPCQ